MDKENNKKLKVGKVVLMGRPNTGKSTLLNSIMNQKVAITSPLPQTTRKNIRVAYEDNRGLILFSDTPGIINKIEDLVGKRINKEAPKELSQADIILMLVDISRPKTEEENKVIGLIRKVSAKKVLVYNKIDIAKGSKEHLPEYNYLEDEFDRTIDISALRGKNVKGLINILFELLPERKEKDVREFYEMHSSKDSVVISVTSEEYVEEIIREKAYLYLREEVPYSINVEVEEIKDKGNIIVIKANILTSAERYKKMIIGKGGKKIREIGYNSRKELELMSGRKVFLELNVITDKHWPERILEETI
ncbi:MAG: GTPase Era [Patescibacteria group bacterium]|jgi:GTP-binding protein Era